MSIPSEDYLRKEVDNCFFLVRGGNRVVGFVHGAVRHLRDEAEGTIPFNARALVLEGLYVCPDRRSNRIADALVRRSLLWAEKSGIGYAKLDIAGGDSERILSFYERFGFPPGKTERKL